SSAPPSEASTSSPPARSGEPARRRTPSADANLAAREAAATAANLLIAGLRADRQGAMRDLLENGGPTGDARSLLEGVGGAEVASGPPGMLAERPGGDCAGCDGDRSLGRLARSGNGGRALSE